MCTSPLTIKNPFRDLGHIGANKYKNTHTAYIQVPCGCCHQCLSMRQAWVNQRVQMESFRSHFFFFTLTYNDESLRYTDIGEYKLAYPDYKDIQNMFKRIRKLGYKLRYWVVSEYGSKRFRPHFHGLLAIDKELCVDHDISVVEKFLYDLIRKEWKRNYGDNFNPDYRPLYDHHVRREGLFMKSTFDLHYVEPIPDHDNDLSFYLSKYIFKYDERIVKLLQKIRLDQTLDDVQSKTLISLLKPRSIMSKDFGSYKLPKVANYISSGLVHSDLLPQFFDINTGQRSMLSRYYQKHIVPSEFYVNRQEKYSYLMDSFALEDTNDFVDYEHDRSSSVQSLKRLNKIKSELARKY